jgi:hypothetical protein
VRAVAVNNDFEQFKVFLEPKLEGLIIDRHEAKDALFQAFFDKPDFRRVMFEFLAGEAYPRIRSGDDRAS